jgi:alanine racemase
MGYSNGLRVGPCVLHGKRTRILEVGMQSAFVEVDDAARVGDHVTLLGDGLGLREIAQAWRCSPQDVLVQLTRTSRCRTY